MELGTVIEGTLRTDDLLEAFINTAHWEIFAIVGTGKYLPYISRLLQIEDELTNKDADKEDYVNLLIDMLNELCPEGVYFGAHTEDGSDFGFWEIEEDD